MQKRVERAEEKKNKDRSLHCGAREAYSEGTVQLHLQVHRLGNLCLRRHSFLNGETLIILILSLLILMISHKLMRQSLDVIELHQLLLALVLLQHNPILQLLFLLIQILVPYDLVLLDRLVRLLHDVPHVLRRAIFEPGDLAADLGLGGELRRADVADLGLGLDEIERGRVCEQLGHLLLEVLGPSWLVLDIVINADLNESISTRYSSLRSVIRSIERESSSRDYSYSTLSAKFAGSLLYEDAIAIPL